MELSGVAEELRGEHEARIKTSNREIVKVCLIGFSSET
jgi:hypothetical protein